MGFALPKQLQEDIHKAVPHLRLILPAAAAVAWVFGKIVRGGHKERETLEVRIGEDEGEIIQVDVPSNGPKLPFSPPRPLNTVLLDAIFPISIQTFWKSVLSGKSNELADFHTELGDVEIQLSQWIRTPSTGNRVRIIQFSTPLKNPFGPKKAVNKEELSIIQLNQDSFVLLATATSKGVPFSNAFENCVQWVVKEERGRGKASVRVTITGECRFKAPVWGPLKGTIKNESITGMKRAYKVLETRLSSAFGMKNTLQCTPIDRHSITQHRIRNSPDRGVDSIQNEKGGGSASERTVLTDLLRSPQANPAVLIVVIATFIILWRMALLNAVTSQMIRRLASA